MSLNGFHVLPRTVEKTLSRHEAWWVLSDHSSSVPLPSNWRHPPCGLSPYSSAWSSMMLSVHSQPGVSVASLEFASCCSAYFSFSSERWVLLQWKLYPFICVSLSAWIVFDTRWVISTCRGLTGAGFAQGKGIRDPASALCWQLNHSLKLL